MDLINILSKDLCVFGHHALQTSKYDVGHKISLQYIYSGFFIF